MPITYTDKELNKLFDTPNWREIDLSGIGTLTVTAANRRGRIAVGYGFQDKFGVMVQLIESQATIALNHWATVSHKWGKHLYWHSADQTAVHELIGDALRAIDVPGMQVNYNFNAPIDHIKPLLHGISSEVNLLIEIMLIEQRELKLAQEALDALTMLVSNFESRISQHRSNLAQLIETGQNRT